MMMNTAFRWEPGGEPPLIEEHSLVKLDVLRRYLRAYFDKLNQGFPRDVFRLDLVDGFAGGGLYLRDGKMVSGSPLVMLEESENAEQRLNQGRVKPLQLDVKHHFVERDAAHAEHLRKALQERGYLRRGEQVALYPPQRFGDALERIISDIAHRQPRSGRSIFLLDQCGYTDADIDMVRRIGERLPNAEVILTVSIDAMLNFSTKENIVSRLASTGLRKGRIEEVLHQGTDSHRKALMQRALPQLALDDTVFNWFTPFFLRPEKSRRELWFVHFSRNAKARDVMLDCHWESHNSFAHYGESFGPKMLGHEALERSKVPLLTFDDGDRKDMNAALTEEFMPELHGKLQAGPLPFVGVLDHFGNRTAATIADLRNIVLAARNAGEIQIVGPDGRLRLSSSLRIIQPNDALVLHPQLKLPYMGKR